MADPNPKKSTDLEADIRLQLTNAEKRQILALYSDPQDVVAEPDSAVARFFRLLPAIAWRWRRRVAMGTLAGAAFGVVYLLAAEPVFIVRALIQIEQRDSVLQRYDTVRSGRTFIATQAEVIRSLVGDAIDALGLPDEPDTWIPFLSSDPSDPRTRAILTAQRALGATPVVGTDVMAISFRTAEPQEGAEFLETLLARYREHVRNLETEAHGEGLELLRRQDNELRIELARLQARYSKLHGEVMVPSQDEHVFSVQRMRLEEQARAHVDAQGRRIELENRLAQHEQSGEELSRKLAELKRDVRASRRTEKMLSRLYDAEVVNMKKLEVQRMNEEQMRTAIKRVGLKREAVDVLLREKEIRVLSMESGHSGTVVRVLEPPRPPMNKVWPSSGIVLSAFGFAGALAGLGMAVFGEFQPNIAGVWRS